MCSVDSQAVEINEQAEEEDMGGRFIWFITKVVLLGVLAACVVADDINPP